jgi:hypothetical protein
MIKVFAKNIDTEAAAQKIVDAAQNRHDHAKLPLDRLISSRVQSPAGCKNNTEFIKALLATLQDTAFVDISDFEIIERRQRWEPPPDCTKKRNLGPAAILHLPPMVTAK